MATNMTWVTRWNFAGIRDHFVYEPSLIGWAHTDHPRFNLPPFRFKIKLVYSLLAGECIYSHLLTHWSQEEMDAIFKYISRK